MENIPFSIIISVVGGFATLGTVFGYFFSLRERVSKLEVTMVAQSKEFDFLRTLTNGINDKLGSIENSLTEIKTGFHYYKEGKM